MVRARPNYALNTNPGNQTGRIRGTVQHKDLPANTPVHRRVRLYRSRDGLLVAQQWSNAVTGEYDFQYVESDQVYTVIADDYAGNWRAVVADQSSDWRHYSLIDCSGIHTAAQAPREYTIAVRREKAGQGGSRFMHDGVQPGDTLTIELPRNDFPLHEGPPGAVLVAGGIGVTPLAGMAARYKSQDLPVRMY